MAKVRMKVSIASPDFSYVPQQEIEIDEDLAEKWVSVGHAEYIEPQKKGGAKRGTKANQSTGGRSGDAGADADVSSG